MAVFNNLIITSSLDLTSTTEDTSSAGKLWFDGTDFRYSALVSGSITSSLLETPPTPSPVAPTPAPVYTPPPPPPPPPPGPGGGFGGGFY